MHKILCSIFLWVILSTFPDCIVFAEDVVPTDPESAAYGFMTTAMDEDINSFYVYADADGGGNHFYPSGFYNGSGTIDVFTRWTDNPHSGSSCIRVQWTGGPGSDGWFWNGVLFEAPEGFLDTLNGTGYDLTGATTLSFWARSDEPGLKVQFGFGHINDPSGERKKWYALTDSWQHIEIDLTGIDLTDVHGGFLFNLNDPNDPDPAGATFYLDDIKYNLSKPDQLRLIRSFTTVTDTEHFDIRSKNLAAVYDNALAILAYLARGKREDIRRALILADTMVFAHEYDTNVVPADWAYAAPPFNGHRLRDGYSSGALIDGQGHFRYAGWWQDSAKKWYMHESALSFRTGDLAWAMIAMANVYHIAKNDKYLNVALEMGTWIVQNCERNGTGMNSGYSGGWVWNWETEEWESIGTSTEHNIDLAAAFGLLHKITKQAAWETRSNQAKEFVQSMGDTEGYFKAGLDSKGKLSEIKVLDVQAWGAMLLQSDPYWYALDWAITYLAYKDPAIPPGWLQFDFNNDIDGIWYEGTAQMASAFRQAGRNAEFTNTILPLRDIQLNGPHADGKGIQAASIKGLTTGFGWKYYDRLGLGPTCWFIFAENGYNPFGAELLVRPSDKHKDELVLNFGLAYGLWHYDQAGGWKQWNTVNPSQMVVVDFNGDGTDELVAAFTGYGLYKKDAVNDWQSINNVLPERMIVADIDGDGKDELVAGFTGYGLYYYDDLGGWSAPINTLLPYAMVRYSDGVICDFGAAYGLWSYNTSDGWVPLNAEDPDKIVAADIDGDAKDELVVSFVGWGVYIYESVGGIWQQINKVIPDEIVAVDIDGDGNHELVVSFNGYGLYTYELEDRTWERINTEIPEGMVRQGNGIAADFGATYGLWVWSREGGWQQRNIADPEQMTVVDIDNDGVEELVVSFPGYGLYRLHETDGWQLLNAVVPEDMKPCIYKPDYVPCLRDDACANGQVCDRSECLSCCPGSTGPCILACCGKCVDQLDGFCGWSSNGPCASDADCMTGGCSGQVCQSIGEEPVITTCEWTECYSAEAYGATCGCVNATCQWK